jgi:hypothetical protein
MTQFVFCSSLSTHDTNLLAVMHVQTSCQNALNWHKENFQHVSNLTDSNSAISKNKFLHSIHIFIWLACWWVSQAFSIFNRGHTAFELGIPFKTCVLPIVCSPKAAFNISDVFVAIFPCLEQNLMQTLFFQVCHFLVMPESQMGQHTLVLNESFLNSQACYSFISNGKWLSRCYSTYNWQ